MSDESRMITGLAVGAVLGAVGAYLIFTGRGRRTLDNMDVTLDEVSHALEKFRRALRRADGIAHETRGAVDDVRAVLKGEGLTAGV